MAQTYWAVEPLWKGQTVFIIAGGPSVLRQNIGALEGRNVIAINSSYETAPFAQYCFFGDTRWFQEHKNRPLFKAFKGKKVSCAEPVQAPDVLKLRRVVPPPGFTANTNCVACQKTSLQGGMNMARHLGVAKMVLLGADMRRGDGGRSHHHRPHKWINKPGDKTWDRQMPELSGIVDPLKKEGIEVINTSPISRIPWWPIVPFEECLR